MVPAPIVAPMVWLAGLVAWPLDLIADWTDSPSLGERLANALTGAITSEQLAAIAALLLILIASPVLIVIGVVLMVAR